jgi:hypothetical protein
MVRHVLITSRRVKDSHTEEQIWLPLSEVICCGTPNHATQPPTRVAAQLSTKVERSGTSTQLVVQDSQKVCVTAARRWKRPYQVDVQVTELLVWVGDGLWYCHRLLCYLRPLTMLAVPTPSHQQSCQAGPHEPAGDVSPGRPDVCVGQVVNGIENGASKGSGH